jgi:hypothetical protein
MLTIGPVQAGNMESMVITPTALDYRLILINSLPTRAVKRNSVT